MKTMKIIKKFLIGMLVVVFFAFAIAMTVLLLNYNKYGVAEISGSSFVMINEEVSSENYKKGDLVIVKKTKIDKIKKGDEVFAYKVNNKGEVSIDIGIVDKISTDDNAIAYENGATYSMDYVVGKAANTYSKIGFYLSLIQSKWGFLFIILVPSFFMFLYQVYSLIIEIKYGDDELEEYEAKKKQLEALKKELGELEEKEPEKKEVIKESKDN